MEKEERRRNIVIRRLEVKERKRREGAEELLEEIKVKVKVINITKRRRE